MLHNQPEINSKHQTIESYRTSQLENNKILYYLSPYNETCFYSKSPCTHIRNKKLKN